MMQTDNINDGWPDVTIGNEFTPGSPGELDRNDGERTFAECALESGVAIMQFIRAETDRA